MSWDYETPTCLYCKHSERHMKTVNFHNNGYPYYTWACTNFGCECEITDRDLIM